jgi:predicted dehydrogenase
MQRVCVIGMGPIGNRHADMYRATPLAELVGVCDIIKERADKAAARLDVPAFYNAQEMLRALKPDITSVTTGGYEYSSDHYEPTMQALEAGCHVLGEKPISNEIAKAEEMVAKAREKGLCYGINLNHRFTEATWPKRWQNEGRLGHLLFVNMSMWIKNPAKARPTSDQGAQPAHRRCHAPLLRRRRGRAVLCAPRRRAGRSGPPRTSACGSRTASSAG